MLEERLPEGDDTLDRSRAGTLDQDDAGDERFLRSRNGTEPAKRQCSGEKSLAGIASSTAREIRGPRGPLELVLIDSKADLRALES